MKPISLGIFIFLFVFHSLSSQDLRLNSGKAQKGRKRVGDRTSAEKIGMLFFVWGGAHIAIAPALDDADQSNTLIGIGLTEMVLGVAMARIFRQKPTITSQECPLMKAGKRLWAIE